MYYFINFICALPAVYITYQGPSFISTSNISMILFVIGWLVFFQYTTFSLIKKTSLRWLYLGVGILISLIGTVLSTLIYAIIIGNAISKGLFS